MFKKDPLQIVVFQSYGTNSHLYVRGRALEDESIDLDQHHIFHLLVNSWKRFESDEIKYANLKITLPDSRIIETQTDDHGYFLVDTTLKDLHALTNEEGWVHFEVSYSDDHPKRKIQNNNRFQGELLVPSEKEDYGVVTDIDDTLLHTGVVSLLKWRVIYNTIFKNAKHRLPLEGAPGFYHLLHRGRSGENANPIFYVSHSPWNMYRYLELFLRQHQFPKGPILLRSFKNILQKKRGDKPQKQKEILNILKTYPKMKFILIGDSGEFDADIYIEIAQMYPDRILAIYLRSVKHNKKMLRVRGLFENYKTTPVLLVESSEEAIAHARANKFIK
ncbi:App1 family protein [Mangrovimonas sp. DI 80]|uniref:App1 family protein n=1 Tax=Mangrovimonas sp. DI 80 TaxID=1779330 RepID=UPI000977A57E|nr:phosphatase domain-containing protein [Mangrovimonas sp. DI 80]OMP31486.1 hypothetical protein BKM32_07140 [Mangrovimonas sp. DI 80]